MTVMSVRVPHLVPVPAPAFDEDATEVVPSSSPRLPQDDVPPIYEAPNDDVPPIYEAPNGDIPPIYEAPAPAHDIPPIYEAPNDAAAIAAQEQAELLATERKRAWHQRRWLRVLLALVVIAGIAAVVPWPLRITAECTVIPRERVNVRAELGGVLSEILVDEGQQVKKGDVLAKLDDRALQAERLRTLADIERYTAEVALLKTGSRKEEIQRQQAVLAARKSEVAFAAKEAHRRTKMVRQGVGSQAAADQANGQLAERKQAVSEAEAALRLLVAGSRPEEVAAREAILQRARAELAFVDQKIAMTVIRAPIDGEVLTPRFRERLNEGIELGGLICEIANTKTMRAEVFVPQRDVDAIAVGMPVTVKVESHPTHPFEGKVAFISPAVDGADRRVRVIAELDNAKGLLKPNMTGYGEIESGDRPILHLATRRVIRWIRVRFLI
jgi:putative peptide zinc metalloprotease protein